jgi:hypothetical protein
MKVICQNCKYSLVWKKPSPCPTCPKCGSRMGVYKRSTDSGFIFAYPQVLTPHPKGKPMETLRHKGCGGTVVLDTEVISVIGSELDIDGNLTGDTDYDELVETLSQRYYCKACQCYADTLKQMQAGECQTDK